jgi:GNAT superfamily N-acetyltransferase
MLELALRNHSTGRRFSGQARRLNRELRVLKRLVIHPDIRGCGLGHWLVRRTLPQAGTPFVECLAAMGAVTPVFEKAGMRRIGICRLPAPTRATVARLRAAGADPLADDFASEVCRRPAVRRLVFEAVDNWYRATTSERGVRIGRKTPRTLAQTFRQLAGSQPVYYLWSRDQHGRELIEREFTGGAPEGFQGR